MSRKRIIGWVSTVLGLILIVYAVHSMQKASEAKGFVKNFTDFFSHNTTWNPLIKFFGGEALKEASKYDVTILIMLILGIVLTVLGLSTLFISRNRSKS